MPEKKNLITDPTLKILEVPIEDVKSKRRRFTYMYCAMRCEEGRVWYLHSSGWKESTRGDSGELSAYHLTWEEARDALLGAGYDTSALKKTTVLID